MIMFCLVGKLESEKIQQRQSSDEGICSYAPQTSNSQPSSSCVHLLRDCCPTLVKTVLLFFQEVHFHNSVHFSVTVQFLIFMTSDLHCQVCLNDKHCHSWQNAWNKV